jgi:hypothetical protein
VTLCAGRAGGMPLMKVPCDEGLASHAGPESFEGVGEALIGESVSRALTPKSLLSGTPTPTPSCRAEGNTGRPVVA